MCGDVVGNWMVSTFLKLTVQVGKIGNKHINLYLNYNKSYDGYNQDMMRVAERQGSKVL